jgi:hypothetical protein
MSWHQTARHLGRAFLAVLFLAPAAWAASLDGTWKITSPQVSLLPEGGSIPFSPQGMEAYEKNKAAFAKGDFDDYDHMQSRCASPGLPRVMLTPERFELFQRSHLIFMVFEWNRLRRTIILPALPKQAGDDLALNAANLVGTAMGTSKGHWEGDTLVVESQNFAQSTLLDQLLPHGYDMKITERIRLKNSQTLEDRITVDDHDYFTHPWTATVTYRRQPASIIPEDVCLDRLRGPPPLATH